VGLQNPPAFPSGAELRLWYAHSCGGQGLILPCGGNHKRELILSQPLTFKIFGLVQKFFVKFLKGFSFAGIGYR